MAEIPEDRSAISVDTQCVQSKARRLAYRAWGEGMPLILCNRYRGVMDSWDPAFLDTLALNFNVITFDYTGFGRSTGTPTYRHMALALDAIDLADALNLDRFVIAGWSLGGIAAQLVASEFPDRVTHGVLIGTTPPTNLSAMTRELLFQSAHRIEKDLDGDVALYFEPASKSSRMSALHSHERIATRTCDLSSVVPESLAAKLLADSDKPHIQREAEAALDRLRSIKVPLLAVCGDHDVVFPVQNWFGLLGEIPSLQLLIYPLCGNAPHHQHPIAVGEYVDTFVRTTCSYP
jgi:pimeloyl-ACP methyl ester carboxylesterase